MVRRRVFVRTVVFAAVCGGSLVAGSVSAGGGPSPTPTPPPGPVSVPALPYDFNGDGYPELVIGDRWGVWVVPGSWRGPSSSTATRWTGSSPGLAPGGGSLDMNYASADFDRDGYADLAASSSETGAEGSTTYRAGAVRVLYGSAAGLTSARNQVWWQDTPGIADTAELHDWFGGELAAGDLDDDGFDDLVVGSPFEDLGQPSVGGAAGALHVIYGSATGLTAAGSQMWTQDSGGVPDVAEKGEYFGEVVLVADVTADGVDDVVIGIPNESVGAVQNAGAVMVLPGSPSGVTSRGAQMWTQDSPGVATSVMEDDGFGYGIAVGNFGGGPELELAVSAVGEDALGWPGSSSDPPSGAIVHELLGTPSGLTGLGSRTWNQATPGIAESPEPGETFGSRLASGDMNGDGYDDLAVRVTEYLDGTPAFPNSDVDGAVHVIYGSSAGLVTTGSQFWHQEVVGVPGESTGESMFGDRLQVIDLDRDGRAELLAGSPWDAAPHEVGESFNAGTVNLFRGSSSGLTVTGAQLWYLGAYGIPGPPAFALFGGVGSASWSGYDW